ncbi:predicted protein [Plenodomus lingam JN3]|uniref:Predicted protein n=1 Tax=Leptosphaeria maculans (strain JN3 / isolate v23.1.3 / race Av1-4-5-6-7-8) TaxID=985895 RepID=E5AF15_LEPMJ|nr:predicted protein [Plenodomus lingam JN3]CBY01804.1 predicted protein [Plenodomus lingam JN3]
MLQAVAKLASFYVRVGFAKVKVTTDGVPCSHPCQEILVDTNCHDAWCGWDSIIARVNIGDSATCDFY